MSEEGAEEVLNARASDKISELDDPRTRDAIERTLNIIFKVMRQMEMPDLSSKVLVSSLASGAVNALVAKGTWDPIVHIFVDADLLVFVASVAKIACQCLVGADGKSIASKAETERALASTDVQAATMDLFRASTVLGSVRASKPFVIPPHLLSSWHMLNQTMGAFVLGHELAHVLLGHIDDEATVTGSMPEVENADILLFSQEAELHADRDGALLAATSAHAHLGHSLLDIASPYIFMRALRLLEDCEVVFGRKRGELDSSHPPAHLRAAFIRQVLVHKLPCGADLTAVLDRIDEFMGCLASLVLAEMHILKAAGITPVHRVMLHVFEKPAILG
uniref:Uncharacterized protein n=1 Tax=Paracoccus aminophilus JCM 7686 TaxID=1367847 RepID=E7BLE2_PARAH|nr:hypothetical protein [Paracoccus aminophilus]ADF47147.1 hypothetical protein [Paracoccus aminophilus JCM 7686]